MESEEISQSGNTSLVAEEHKDGAQGKEMEGGQNNNNSSNTAQNNSQVDGKGYGSSRRHKRKIVIRKKPTKSTTLHKIPESEAMVNLRYPSSRESSSRRDSCMTSVVLAIDAGSSSIRCIGYEYLNNSQEVSEQQPPSSPPPQLVSAIEGIAYTIPMQSVIPNTGHIRIHKVLTAIDECIDEVLLLLRQNMSGSSYEVVAIGFSTFVMNLVGVDVYGEPVGESATLSYACNREDVVKECQELINELGPEKLKALYERTGAPIHPAYATPQLLAFYRNEQNNSMFRQIEKWQTISSICLHRWCGKPFLQMPISYCEASWTGMLDFRTCAWDDEVVELLEKCEDAINRLDDNAIDDDDASEHIELLPPVVDYDAELCFLQSGIPQYCGDGSINTYWERWPELRSRSLSLFLGVGDGASANVGSKCGSLLSGSGSHRIAVTIGTSAAARVCLPLPIQEKSTPIVPPGLFCYRLDRDRVLLGGALTDGGSVVEWARSLLNLQSDESFEACLEKVRDMYEKRCTTSPADRLASSSVTMIPFLSGERSTGFRGGAVGCLSGITRETSAADLMYACLESVILRIGCVLKLMNGVCCSQQAEYKSSQGIIVASGNALERNSLWRQMLADCSSMDVVIDCDSREGTSRGVAMLMAGSMRQREGQTYNFEEPLEVAHESKTNTSSPGIQDHWRVARLSQESFIDAMSPTWKA